MNEQLLLLLSGSVPQSPTVVGWNPGPGGK